jgi:hypothetical protein
MLGDDRLAGPGFAATRAPEALAAAKPGAKLAVARSRPDYRDDRFKRILATKITRTYS